MSMRFIPFELRERNPESLELISKHRKQIDSFWSSVSVSVNNSLLTHNVMTPEETNMKKKKKESVKRRSSLKINIEKLLLNEKVLLIFIYFCVFINLIYRFILILKLFLLLSIILIVVRSYHDILFFISVVERSKGIRSNGVEKIIMGPLYRRYGRSSKYVFLVL